ncbi:MAG: DUF1800 family protein [Chitinophagaceae bacterium]
MGQTMPRRQFLNSLAAKSSSPIPQTVEKSFTPIVQPTSTYRTEGALSGINAYTGAWTEAEMMHLLRRVCFGAPKAALDQIKGMSMSAAVDFLIDNPVQPATTPVNNYTVGTDTGGVAFGNSWVTADLPDPLDSTIRSTLNNSRLGQSFKPWWMGQMINQQTHILEKLTLFWANHFGTDTANNNRPKAIFQHYKLLRTYGLGSFRDLIRQVTVDPHMLYFLNGNNSYKTAPNENYGRELQELFTIGKRPESPAADIENDVKAAAKILTGWVVSQSAVTGTYSAALNATRHNTELKTFSSYYGGKTINVTDGAAEIDALLDMLLQHTECAKYLVRRLYIWFVYSTITPEIENNVIAPLATIFRNSNYSIPVVLKAIFKSEHFFDPLNRGGIIKSPVDLYVGMAREFKITLAAAPVDIQYAHWKNFSDRCANQSEGQNIGDPPNVAGWPAYYNEPSRFYETWMSGASIQVKARNLKSFNSKNGVTVSGVKLQVDPIAFNKGCTSPGDINAVVPYFIFSLLPVDLTTEQKDTMKKILLNNQANENYWTSAWNDYMANPTNTTFMGIVQTRLYDLLTYVTALAEYFLY